MRLTYFKVLIVLNRYKSGRISLILQSVIGPSSYASNFYPFDSYVNLRSFILDKLKFEFLFGSHLIIRSIDCPSLTYPTFTVDPSQIKSPTNDSVLIDSIILPKSTLTSRAAVVSIFAIAFTNIVPILVGSGIYPCIEPKSMEIL